MSWKGTLEFVDLGPGQWVLTTDGGDRISLFGEVPRGLTGKRVEVQGTAVEAHGFGMVGPQGIEVSKVSKA